MLDNHAVRADCAEVLFFIVVFVLCKSIHVVTISQLQIRFKHHLYIKSNEQVCT